TAPWSNSVRNCFRTAPVGLPTMRFPAVVIRAPDQREAERKGKYFKNTSTFFPSAGCVDDTGVRGRRCQGSVVVRPVLQAWTNHYGSARLVPERDPMAKDGPQGPRNRLRAAPTRSGA